MARKSSLLPLTLDDCSPQLDRSGVSSFSLIAHSKQPIIGASSSTQTYFFVERVAVGCDKFSHPWIDKKNYC